MSCGQTDWVGFVVPQYKRRSPENVRGGGESELSQVMLAYTVLFLFSAKTLSFFFKTVATWCFSCWCLNLCMHVHSFTGILELDDSDDCVEPT